MTQSTTVSAAVTRGWTFVEMLVAISLSAVFMGAAALVYASISTHSKRLARVVTVTVGEEICQAFYEQEGATIGAYAAPNYGRAALAQDFRDRLIEEAAGASVIHCLPRSRPNTVRPQFLPYAAGEPGSTQRPPRLDSPEDFRRYLIQAEPAAAAIYDLPIRNVPAATHPNSSLFLLAPSEEPGHLRVLAVYEIDFLSTSQPLGTYASVRRYQNGSLSHYYDVFYPGDSSAWPLPSFVAFEHRSRRAVLEGTAIDRFKVAESVPFYFLWLPDPAVDLQSVTLPPPSAPAHSPLAAYEAQGARSSLGLVLPVFPEL